jgi:prephenate dehydrogenase
MNKYFEDTRYYLKRAGQTAKKGVKEELEPIENRFRELTGDNEEPEPSRLDKIRNELNELEEKAEGEAKEAIANARDQIKRYRNRDD